MDASGVDPAGVRLGGALRFLRAQRGLSSAAMTSSVPPAIQVMAAIAGIVSAFGVVIALIVIFRDTGRYDQDRKDRAEDRQDRAEDRADRLEELRTQAVESSDRQAAQARLVTCTLGEDYMMGLRCRVTNHSAAIILDLHVREPINRVETGWRLVPADAPDEAAARGRVVLPGQILHYSLETQDASGVQQEQIPPGQFQATTAPIEFTDSAGLRWTRTGTEQPRRSLDVEDA